MALGRTTWDGLPVAADDPRGTTVAVWRRAGAAREWLLLHRAHQGTDYAGDWAWTPPSGARLPGEPVAACARRELREETGLELDLVSVDAGAAEWAAFVAEAPADADVCLDAEHDRFEWLPLPQALERCLPALVSTQLAAAASALDRR